MSKLISSPKNLTEACFVAELLSLSATTPEQIKKINQLIPMSRSRLSRRQLKKVDRLVYLVKQYYIKNL